MDRNAIAVIVGFPVFRLLALGAVSLYFGPGAMARLPAQIVHALILGAITTFVALRFATTFKGRIAIATVATFVLEYGYGIGVAWDHMTTPALHAALALGALLWSAIAVCAWLASSLIRPEGATNGPSARIPE